MYYKICVIKQSNLVDKRRLKKNKNTWCKEFINNIQVNWTISNCGIAHKNMYRKKNNDEENIRTYDSEARPT